MHKYQQLQKVGSGNFSSVHLVRNTESGQTAAMKLMKTHQNIALKEAYFLKNFDHPNIVRLLDFDQDPVKGETRIVLEYLPENTLELYEQQQFGLREEQVKCVLFQAALGLAYVHERGIIHRDIKPENILIDKRKAEIKLIDFGLAVSLEKVATDYVATRWYRAPENLLGTKEYSCLIDVFSLACVVVELYLGNPLFPGADNLDQLHRIFNILGEPTDASWPAGARKFRELGFKTDPARRREESFGLRSLLKACSEGLVALLERMLVLNPKKRISTREIVVDPYFTDVKTIIPPTIYKRFEKDHILKKTTRDAIENAETFIHSARSRRNDREETQQQQHPHPHTPQQQSSLLVPTPQQQQQSSLLAPNAQEANGSNCAIMNLALSPRRSTLQEERKTAMHVVSPKQPQATVSALRPPHELPSSVGQQSILAFRGFNPIKNNKISVKETRKQQESHSQQKASRENSLDAKPKPHKLISNSIDLGKKLQPHPHPHQHPKPERRLTNERDYRTPEHKDNPQDPKEKSLDYKEKSVDRNGRVLYYFQGDRDALKPSPLKVAAPRHLPIQASLRLEPKNTSLLSSETARLPTDSTRITRNNSAINLPSVRLPDPIHPRERISHSPGVIPQRVELRREEFQPKESIYVSSSRPFEKLKILTAPVPAFLHPRHRNDRSQEHSAINLSSTNDAQQQQQQQQQQQSMLRGGLEFKEKVLVHGNRQMINQPARAQLIEPPRQQPAPSLAKVKQYRSVEAGGEKKEAFSIGQFKTLQIEERREYREPRISAKADLGKLAHLLSPRENSISINLNVSIIDNDKDKPELKRTRI